MIRKVRNRPVPRVLAIHDLSGLGGSSLSIVLPILSTLGAQVCALPTALLSTQTSGYEDFTFLDLSDEMEKIMVHWKTLKIEFEALYSGFLGSGKQIDIVLDCIQNFGYHDKLTIIDPVLGDDGTTYGPIKQDIVSGMRTLIGKADLITPNFTEAALLLHEKYREHLDVPVVKEWLVRLAEMGPGIVIITSVPIKNRKGMTSVFAYDAHVQRFWKVECMYVPATYPGTGDMFTSVITGCLLQGDSLPIAMDRAVQFVSQAVRATFGYSISPREGVLLEHVLGSLRNPVPMSTYELVD